jgi:hypothetical protein
MSLEWKETCSMALNGLCKLLPLANTSSDLVQFMSNHDIDSEVRNLLPISRVSQLDAHILAFLSVSPFIKSGLHCHGSQLNYSALVSARTGG